ncbi:MAG: hypothetical protein IPM54_06275 [Polyangiaceae bacterium]|nr:hypothetical protein [Polyangiaceae bacterium]
MMDVTSLSKRQYHAPTYRLEPDEAWYHFLHGNVPGHEIDFIYHPEVPQKPLTRQHVNHLVGLLKFIEPRQGMAYAFAIANLSLGDSQFEPGHGGVAFVFGLRIKGAYDHAGRHDPPFCHAAALIDRHLDAETIYGVSAQFYQKLLPDEESRVEGSGWYHTYVANAQNEDALPRLLRGYVQDFADVLYTPPRSELALRWTTEPPPGEKAMVPRRMVVVYPDKADFATLAYGMARIAAVLIESDLRWTAISNGREPDIAGGMAVRFVPRREADNEPEDVVLLYLEQLPEHPAEIAQLFGMYPARQSRLPELRVNIPLAAPAPLDETSNGASHSGLGPVVMDAVVSTPGFGGVVGVVEKRETFDAPLPQRDLVKELKRKERKQSAAMMVGIALLVLVFGVFALVWMVRAPRDPDDMVDAGAPVQPAVSATAPRQTVPPTVKSNAPPVQAPTTATAAVPDAVVVPEMTVAPAPTTAPTVKPMPTTKSVPTAKPVPKKKNPYDEGWE